jgi:hypothetical protein
VNGKLPTAPIFGELVQLLGLCAVVFGVVVALVAHEWRIAILTGLGIAGYFVGRRMRGGL